MLSADSRADGVNAGDENLAGAPLAAVAVADVAAEGEDFVDGGGVSGQDSRDSTSSASLLESGNSNESTLLYLIINFGNSGKFLSIFLTRDRLNDWRSQC